MIRGRIRGKSNTVRVAVAMIAAAAVGCGRSDLHRVSGRVHFPDGTPLPTGRVVVDYAGQHPGGAWGGIKSDGSFTIGTMSENDGMKAGRFRVAIVEAYAADPQQGLLLDQPLVDRRFNDPATSGLSFEVPRQLVWDIEVEKPASRKKR